VHIAIIGGGVAGTLLALRLSRSPRHPEVDLFLGAVPPGGDASGASGGMVRGFETDQAACRAAAESLVELHGSSSLREWSGYRETGSVYLLADGADQAGSVTILAELLPRSAEVVDRVRLARDHPFRELPPGAVAVVERRAGHLSPDRLRAGVLAELARVGVALRRIPVSRVTSDPVVRTGDGAVLTYDAVVLAAGAWTPRILRDSGLPDGNLRTKQIQYSVCHAALNNLCCFVDDGTGLYGRPLRPGAFLLGLPTDRWEVNPDRVTRDHKLAEQVVECAERTFGTPVRAVRTVASFDCFHDPAGLALRPAGTGAGLYTFTGGSGGAAKTVLAASRAAANVLLQ
jgi:glycine/D-amino acid oxidase-like deaminating enzyme